MVGASCWPSVDCMSALEAADAGAEDTLADVCDCSKFDAPP